MKNKLDAKELEREFAYRKIMSDNAELRSRLNQKNFELINIKKKQEQIINKEVTIRTKSLVVQHKEEIKEKNKEIKLKEEELKEKDKQIEALKETIAKMKSKIDNDSTNSGLPTSKTPIGKKKYIPNTREKTEKSVGGQTNHPKHKLKGFKEEEATEVIEVQLDECPKCGSKDIIDINEDKIKCETDYEVKIIKRMYKFKTYKCNKCAEIFHNPIPNDLKEENQYGKTLQSLAVCLTNEIYTPFNKTVKLVSGITNNEINMSEGYVTKLQKRASNNLDTFIDDLKDELIKQPILGWDDGVVEVNTKNAILRTYCTDNLAIFMAHEHKNEKSLEEDGILTKLSGDTILMHDHLLHNYNEKYNFENVECVIHLIRRLKKSMNDIPEHTWQEKMKKFLSKVNDDRNKILQKNTETQEKIELKFSDQYLKEMEAEYNSIIKLAKEENKRDNLEKNYFKKEEASFIDDLIKYKKNYLLWAYRFDIPSTNNACERKIRPVKSKLKISGQFKNIEYAEYYARIRSYIETCKINGINIIDACVKLMNGEPYSIKDILALAPKKID